MSQTSLPWRQYICRACGLIYDEAEGDPDSGLAPGTRFEDIPDDWECPLCGVTKLDFEAYVERDLSAAPNAAPPAAETGVVIVGGGLSGWSVAEALRAIDRQVPITLITACSGDVYHKPELSVALSRRQTASALVRERGQEAAKRLGIRLLPHTFAVGLSTALRQLRTTRGTLAYTRLVLAQGAGVALPANLPAELCWRVNHLDGWSGLRTRLAERSGQRIAVVGAGMIGCELAEDLVRAGHQVILFDRHALPLPDLLPDQVARRLRAAQQELGIEVLAGVEVAALYGLDDNRKRLLTRCGQQRVVDQVVAAIGLVAEPRLARLAGLTFDRGIAVNPVTLQTSDPHIYALGDCISLAGAPCRFIEPIARQARAIAAHMSGIEGQGYTHSAPIIRLKTPSLPIVMHGMPCAGGVWQVIRESDGFLHMEQQFNDQSTATLRVGRPAAA